LNIVINLEGIQENKKYNLEFCLRTDGKVILETSDKIISKTGINIDDYKESKPTIEEVKSEKKKMVLTSSFTGKINEGDKI
jgi:hypothetical protein